MARSKAKAVKAFIAKGDAAVSGELAARFASKYPLLTSFKLGNTPMVKESALPTGLRVLVWCVVVLVCGGVYGDIHLVTPLITAKQDKDAEQEMEGFCQAVRIVQ